MKHKQIKTIPFSSLQERLNQSIQRFSIDQFKKNNYLKYQPASIVNNTSSIIKPIITYFAVNKFPLLISLTNRSQFLANLDNQIKNVYQSFSTKLPNQFYFQHFIFLTVKRSKNFLESLFQEIQIVHQDQRQMYCLMIKILLGFKVHGQAYSLLEKKFTDKDKYQHYPLLLSKKAQSNKKQSNKRQSKKQSMGLIQAKLERRKLHRLKTNQRNSISITHRGHEIQQFKQNLMKELKVINEADKKLTKIKYAALQQQNFQQTHNKKYLINASPIMKNVIQTQQISASLELSLHMKNSQRLYSKRNIAIKLTDLSQRLSHPLFQPVNYQSLLMSEQIPKKQKTVTLNKKTKTYWKKMANHMRLINESFQY